METVRVHVDRDNYIDFSCPHCEKSSRLLVAKFKNIKHKLTTRCTCGSSFEVHLNFRRFFRKKTKLVGEVKKLSSYTDKWFAMTVINLSMSGLCLKVIGPTDIKKGDKLRVKFTLDNSQADLIDKEIVVKDARNSEFGCEFQNLAYEEKELGFYLFQN